EAHRGARARLRRRAAYLRADRAWLRRRRQRPYRAGCRARGAHARGAAGAGCGAHRPGGARHPRGCAAPAARRSGAHTDRHPGTPAGGQRGGHEMTRYARMQRGLGVLLALGVGAGGADYAHGGGAPPPPITLSAAEPARRRAALLNDLAHVRSELVRIELPPEVPVPPAGAVVRLRSAAATMQAKVLGMLPVADPRLQTRGVLAELSGSQAQLAVGQMLSAQLPAPASAAGVILPRDALLREGSQVWAYVQTGPATFVRREVTGFQPLTAGWFVSGGFAPGER